MSIIVALLVFGLLIFIHELGHCVAAKKSGILVHEFAIGMGWKLFGFTVNKNYFSEKPVKKFEVKREKNQFTFTINKQTDKQKKDVVGETVYSLRLFPFGGFCAMEGENEDSDNPRAFGNKSVGKRMIVIVAGAFMNLVLGLVVLLIMTAEFDEVLPTNKVALFKENSASAERLQVGDEILKIGKTTVFTSEDIRFQLLISSEDTFDVTIRRDGEKMKLKDVRFNMFERYYENEQGEKIKVTPEKPAPEGEEVLINDLGSVDFMVQREEKTPLKVLGYAFKSEATYIQLIFTSLNELITGKVSVKEVSGPVGIVSFTSQTVDNSEQLREAIYNVLFLIMLLTINLGVFNLLPIPALDGGRFVFLLIEAIRRKKIDQKIEGTIHGVMFMLLMMFIVFVSINDIGNLFKNLQG